MIAFVSLLAVLFFSWALGEHSMNKSKQNVINASNNYVKALESRAKSSDDLIDALNKEIELRKEYSDIMEKCLYETMKLLREV